MSANHGKPSVATKKVVWRISDKAPLGEIVDPQLSPEPVPLIEKPEVSSGGWIVSSFDLLNGTDIQEGPDTVPAELFDELFAPTRATPKPPTNGRE